MPSETKRAPVVMTAAWQDICALAGLTNIAGQTVVLQADAGYASAEVIFGGASAPAGADAGILLYDKQAMRGSAANIWVRGNGRLKVHKE